MKNVFLFAIMFVCSLSIDAQVYAQLKIWDSHERHPKINQIEFQPADEALASYDAIYGHGTMWESEYVGFRIYMDHRQSIDLYGKKTLQLELDSTNFYSNADWMAKGYGEDILFCGPSISAGAFRGVVEGKLATIDKVSARGQRIVNAGPDTVVVEVWDKDWQINGKTLQMTQRYTMLSGHRDVQVDIYIEGGSDSYVYATGVQKLEMENHGFCFPEPGKHLPKGKSALVGSWGRNVPDKAHPELIEGVGIGVTVPAQYLVGTEEDDLNYLCYVHPVNGHIRYHLAVAAEMEIGGFKESGAWFGWLRQWASQLVK